MIRQPIVTVKQGKLQGIVQENVIDSYYYSFRGIPFAAPPINELRFKDPEPPISWEGIRDASKNAGEICAQIDFETKNVIGGDDCLYLNVYVPYDLYGTVRNPVIILIHDGNYNTGSGNDIRPDFLLAKDIIVVSINYRLGALGFLNLDHEAASGNQGLKDQVAALKWIKENINVFGGDRNNITVFGIGAGSISTHLLMLSPLSKGLFHKAILLSGTATCRWAIRNQLETYSFKLASVLGNDSKNPEEVVKFLQTISTTRIVQAQFEVLAPEDIPMFIVPFGPTIDDKAIRPFLPRPVSELLDDDDNIPIIVGYMFHERVFLDISEQTFKKIYTDLSKYVAYFINSRNPQEIMQVTERCKQWYFNNTEEFTKEDIPSIIRCLSDLQCNIPTENFVEKRRKRKQALTYFCRFTYLGSPLIDDSLYLSDCTTGDRDSPRVDTEDQKEEKAKREKLKILITMCIDFAKTGNPKPVLDEHVTTTWLPATEDSFNYLHINDPIKLLTFTNYDDVIMKGLEF